jgi:aminoglycoside phosphotransferase (APT) family kinase protein
VNVHSIGLKDYGKPANYYQRQLKRWSTQYQASCKDMAPEMVDLVSQLEQHMPDGDGAGGLVHGDYRMDNLIYDAERHEVIAVIDWELSTLGHPVSDLAYQCMQLRLPPSQHEYTLSGLGGLDVFPAGIPSEREYVKEYLQACNHPPNIDKWYFYLAFAFFRLAAIAQGVVSRAQAGNASSKHADQLGPIVLLLANNALAIMEEKPSL